jgi:sterol desaturase/sphingolipid hydroxylase (fatty acid hydroxylase superfamily)
MNTGLRALCYYLVLIGFAFVTLKQATLTLIAASACPNSIAAAKTVITGNLLLLVFCMEALIACFRTGSFSTSSIAQLFRFSVSHETDLILWVVFSTLSLWIAAKVQASSWGGSFFPVFDSQLHLGAAGALLLFSFINFFYHWLNHRIPALWELHKIHHSATELTILTGPREHLVLGTLQILLYLIFFRTETLFFSGLFLGRGLLNLFQHSTVDLRYGWLGYLFISPHSHRIHHLKEESFYGKNLGTDFAIWDLIFGTFIYEVPFTTQEMEASFGLGESDQILSASNIFFATLRATKNSLATGWSVLQNFSRTT